VTRVHKVYFISSKNLNKPSSALTLFVGDLTDIKNYRAIAISNALSKVFESVLIDPLTSYADVDKFQFGFKKGHSTGLCTSMFKNIYVFVCFIDFSTAFDTVNYWKLFTKLLNDNIDCKIVSNWYSIQQCFVRWRSSLSTGFYIRNGTRQGSLLTPYLFARYIRDLINTVVDSGFGCKVAD